MAVHVEITDANNNVLVIHNHEGNNWADACVAAQEMLRNEMTKNLISGTPSNPPNPLTVRWKVTE